MSENERVSQKKQEQGEKKHGQTKQNPEPFLNFFHAWDEGYLSIGETPFQPQVERHIALLTKVHSDEQRANIVIQLQQTYGNRYMQRVVDSIGMMKTAEQSRNVNLGEPMATKQTVNSPSIQMISHPWHFPIPLPPLLTEKQIKSAIRFNKARRYSISTIKQIQKAVGTEDDGIIGRGTVLAIAKWQHKRGLDINGKVGQQALRQLVSEVPSLEEEKKAAIVVTKKFHWKIAAVNTVMELLEEWKQISGERETQLDPHKFFKRLPDPSSYSAYREAGGIPRLVLVKLIGWCRKTVNILTSEETGIEEKELLAWKAKSHAKLNGFTPYYTQMANINFIPSGSTEAWKRTCNVTSLAMVLEGLGITQSEFNGNKKLASAIGIHLGGINSESELTALRMPDFLQLVVISIYYELLGGAYSEESGIDENILKEARVQVIPVFRENLDFFATVAEKFGVSRTVGSIPKNLSNSNYKQKIIREVLPEIHQGKEIIVHRPGHYVRLELISNLGIVIDDPSIRGKNYVLTWEQANRANYFDSYQVFTK